MPDVRLLPVFYKFIGFWAKFRTDYTILDRGAVLPELRQLQKYPNLHIR